MTTYRYKGEVHEQFELDLVLYNIMNDNDECFMDEFVKWLHAWVDRNATDHFSWKWDKTIQDLWYMFVVEYVDEHDREIMERFGVEEVEE